MHLWGNISFRCSRTPRSKYHDVSTPRACQQRRMVGVVVEETRDKMCHRSPLCALQVRRAEASRDEWPTECILHSGRFMLAPCSLNILLKTHIIQTGCACETADKKKNTKRKGARSSAVMPCFLNYRLMFLSGERQPMSWTTERTKTKTSHFALSGHTPTSKKSWKKLLCLFFQSEFMSVV